MKGSKIAAMLTTAAVLSAVVPASSQAQMQTQVNVLGGISTAEGTDSLPYFGLLPGVGVPIGVMVVADSLVSIIDLSRSSITLEGCSDGDCSDANTPNGDEDNSIGVDSSREVQISQPFDSLVMARLYR